MEHPPAFRGLDCTDCGATFDASEPGRCPDCDAPLDPGYDYDAVDADRDSFAPGDSMWAYDDLLPFPVSSAVTAAEGATPLVDAPALAAELGVGRVVVKDESRNPTGTVHDRGMSVAVTAARDHGVEPLAHASAGNSAQSAAAYAGRAGLRSYGFVPSRAPFSNKAMVNVHGGEMRVAGGRYPDAVDALDELATDWYSLQAFTTPYRHEGAKTLAYELLADLDWSVPDAVVAPVATGELAVGIEKGLRELRTLGLVESVPPLYLAQAEGCAPVASAREQGLDSPEPWAQPDTICGELEIPDPPGGRLALAAVDRTGGDVLAVTDRDILESAVVATRHVGVEFGAAAGAAVAVAHELDDALGGDATVAVVNTESGVKTADVLRSHLMSQGV
jgi:threonine synthase